MRGDDTIGKPRRYGVVRATDAPLDKPRRTDATARFFVGKITHPENARLSDLSPRELAVLLPVLVFVVWIGISPGTFLSLSSSKAKEIVVTLESTVKRSLMLTGDARTGAAPAPLRRQ